MLISEEFILLLSNPWQVSWPQVMCNIIIDPTIKYPKKNRNGRFEIQPILLRWCLCGSRWPDYYVGVKLGHGDRLSTLVCSKALWVLLGEACLLSNGRIWSSNTQIHCVSWANVWWCSSPYTKCLPYQLAAQGMGDSSTLVKASSILWLQASYERLEKETWLRNRCLISICLNTNRKFFTFVVLFSLDPALC